MNVFFLHRNPEICAQMHCDKHVVKMILESAQLLSTAHHVLDKENAPQGIYRNSFMNHPCGKWVRESSENYEWLFSLLEELCKEYTHRYKKTHKTEWSGVVDMLSNMPENIPEGDFTDPPQCMPDHCKNEDTVEAYRTYYILEKSYFCKWKNRETPDWFKQGIKELINE